MRYRKPLLALIICLGLTSLAGCNGCDGVGTKTFSITGRVTTAGLGHPVTAHPVTGAAVSVGQVAATTNSAGAFELHGLTTTDSQVTITVTKKDYAPATATVAVFNNATIVQDFYLVSAPAGTGIVSVDGRVEFMASELYGRVAAASHDAWTDPVALGEPDSVLVELESDLTAANVDALLRDVGSSAYEIRQIINRAIVKVPQGRSLDEFMDEIKRSPMVRSVEPNGLVAAARVPNDPSYSQQAYWYGAMNLPASWETITGRADITIAVVDTGLRYNHPDIGNLVPGWDFVDGDSDPWDPGKPGQSISSHGTHVAGTIGALTNNSIGVAGINWNARIMPVRVLDTTGRGSWADISSGIRWAANAGADVINLSLGGYEGSSVLQEAVSYAARRGAIIVAASGNDGISSVMYPAAYPEVIAVGAAAKPNSVADFSNGGTSLDLIAPGVSVYSTNYSASTGHGYAYAQGTSMASPHVAGLVGLMLANGVPSSQVREVLRETAIRPQDMLGWDTWFGYGFVNAYAAVTNARLTRAALVATNDQFDAISSVVYPGSNRQFSMTRLPQAAALYVFGWIDVNNSRSLDDGDYTGYAQLSTLGKTLVPAFITLNIHSEWSPSIQETINKGLGAIGVR